jgi:hypothetical protein
MIYDLLFSNIFKLLWYNKLEKKFRSEEMNSGIRKGSRVLAEFNYLLFL